MAKLAVFIAISLVVFVFMADYSARGDQTILGPRGDFFAGFLNPIIGLITLGVLYATLVTMQKDFNRGIETFEQSQDLIKDNNKQQRFEDTFFSMLNVLIAMGEKVYEIHNIHNNNYGTDQHSLISDAYKELIIQYNDDARNELLLSHKDINSLFRMLYQILKHVDDNFFDSIDDISGDKLKKAKKYTNIVRSTLDSDTYHLLLLNCMVDNGSFMSYKKYLAKYAFVEHVTLESEESNEKYLAFLRAVKISYCNDEYKNTFGDQFGLLNFLEKNS